MFRLNRLTDYAVVVMGQMASDRDRVRSAAQIAEATGVPLPTVAKLMNLLAKDGLIASQRGATGGYRLARGAETISVAEIVQAIEGPIALTACVEGVGGGCEAEHFCPMRGNWNKVNGAIRRALEGVSLADMIPGLCGTLTFQLPDRTAVGAG